MTTDYISEAVEVRIAPEGTRGTSPSSNWTRMQVDVGGLDGFERKYTDVERDIFSVNATQEKGDHVAYDVTPSLVHDMNKDLVDVIGGPAFRCVAKHFGGTGLSFQRPSAVTTTGFTVGSLGAVPNGLLFYTRGFSTAANNGLKLTAGSSTGTEIKCAGLTAEASPPGNQQLDLVGFQGASGDLVIDSNKYLTSTLLDFTTLGLYPGMWIYFPNAAQATVMGAAAYAFATATGRAKIVTVAAHQLTLERWTSGVVADAGTSKTVRVFVSSRLFRNYAIDDATYYSEVTLSAEKTDIKPGTAADTRYTYVKGCGLDSLQVSAPIDSKITATIGMVGMTATTPLAVASRVSGPSSAYAPIGDALVDTQNDLQEVRLTDSGGDLVADVLSWTYSLKNNIKPRKSQGTFGASGLNYGKFMYSVNMDAYYQDSDAIDAADANRSGMAWDAFIWNNQYGIVLDLPNVALRMPKLDYKGNEPVMINCDIIGFRDTTTGVAGEMAVFGYIPQEA